MSGLRLFLSKVKMQSIEHILFAVNPAAGEGRTGKKGDSASKDFGDCGLFISKNPGEIAEFLTGNADKYDLVVAVGGDGTVNECVNGIIKSGNIETMLFNLPSGIGNDYALNLGISEKPAKIKKYCENLREEKNMLRVKELDVWQIDEKYFINYASAGFCAKTLNERNKANFLNGKAKFFFVALMNYLTYKPIEAEIKINEKKIKSRIFSMIISNGKYFGGGMKMAPEARMDDGILDISIIKPAAFCDYVNIWLNSYKEDRTETKNMHFCKSDSVNIKSSEMMPLQIDGEYLGEKKEINIVKAKEKIKVLVPQKF